MDPKSRGRRHPFAWLRSLRAQVLVITLLLVTAPTVLLGAGALAVAEDGLKNTLLQRGEIQAAARASNVATLVNGSREVLAAVAQTQETEAALAAGDAEALRLAARSAYHAGDQFQAVWVDRLGEESPVVYPLEEPVVTEGVSLASQRDAVLLHNGPVVSPVFLAMEPFNQTFVVVSVPLRQDGRTTAILSGAVDLFRLGNRLTAPTPGRTLYLVDDQGWLIFSSDPHAPPPLSNVTDLMGVSQAIDGGRGTVEDEERFAFYARDPVTGWSVVMHETTDIFLGHLRLLETFLMVFMLLVGTASVVLAVMLTEHTTRPLLRVREGARRLASGDWSARVPEAGSREVEEVAEAFNAMAGELRAKTELLDAYAADLEERVAHRTAELAERNRELEAFNHTVAHDLKEPLRGIHTYADIIADDYGEAIPSGAMDYLARIRDRGHRMARLLDGLLHVARVGREENGGRVDVDAVVDNALALLEERLERSGAEVDVERPLPPAMGNADLLVEVFTNLVSNGVKYNDAPTPRVRVWGTVEDGTAHYRVEDNGIGIPPESRGDVFGLFRKLHRREDYAGTGVGLAIVQRVVDRHGGEVWITGREGGGTVVHVALPAWRGGARRPRGPDAAPPGGTE